MITRMWEAKLTGAAEPTASALPAGCEVYLSYDGPPRAVVISHFADEAAVAAYAGSEWRTDAGAESRAFGTALAAPGHVWHFTRLA